MDDDARDGSLPTHPEHEIDEVVIVKDEPYNYYESLDDPIEVSEGDTVTDIVPDTVVLVKTENSPTTGEPENRLIPTDLVIEADFKEEQRAPEPDAEEHVEAGASCDGNNPQAVQPKRYRSGGLEKPNPRYIRIGGYCKRELAQGIDYITCTKGKKGQWTKQCIECSYTTNVTDEMHAHLLNMHNIRRFKCLKCGLTSGKSLKYVKSHFRACYKHKPAAISLHVERIHTHKCPHCSKVLESPSLLSAHHMYSHGDVLKGSCQQCDFKLKPWVSYTQLYNNQIDCMYAKIEADVREPCYICTLCSQAFIYRPAVRSHIKDEHSLKLFKCKWCHHQADWYSVMREHVDKHAGSYPLLRCSQCGFTCRSITDSEKHLRSHGPMLAYICSHCTFTSVRKEGIENHMRYHNIHGRQSVCKHCDAEFPSDGMLKNHVRLYHEVRSSYLHCSRCNFSCRSLMRLITHKRYHRPPKSSQQNKARYRYTCSSCTFQTRWKRSIVSHIRAAQHQRLFRCKLCSYSVVKSRYRLRRHLRKHETAGTPLLQCTRCPFKIIEKSIFQRHLNTHKSTALPTDNSLPSTNLGPQYATSQNRSLIFHVRRPTSYLKRKIITRRKGVHAKNLTYMGSYETIDNISPGKSRSYTLGLNRRVKLKSGRAAARSAAQRFLRLHCLKCRTFSCMSNVTFQSHMKKKHNSLNPRAGTSDSLSTTPVKLAKPEKSDCEGPRRSSRLLNRTAHKQVVGGSPATNHGSDLKDDHTKSTEEQSISCKMTKSSDSLTIPPVLKKHPDILTSSKSRNVRQQQRKPPKGETPYSCMICKFKTHSAKAMTLHLSQHHGFSKTGDHTCDLCDSMLPDLIHLVNHRRMCRFQALNQSKTSDSTTYQLHEWKTPELVISRTRQHKSELYRSSRFKCEVCCYSSNRACDLVRHCKSLSHKRLVAAAENERVTSSLLQINNPRTILTTDSVKNTDIPSASPPNEFSQTTLLNGQPLPGQPPMSQLPSDQPPIGQPSSSQPPSGQLLSAQPAILPPSPVLFKSTTMLNSQQKGEADSAPTSAAIRYKPGQNFECEDCSFSTFNVAELHEHMRDEHDRKRFKCDHCYFSCDRRFDLGRHMRTHTGEKPFSCSLCDYTCAHKGQLTTHQRTHTGRCFKCKLCNFSSTCASNLTRHMRGHYNDRRFKCHHCTFSTYTDRARLNIHIRTHNKKMEYQCTQCSFGARTSGSLQRHIAQEHEGGSELLYKCYRCSLYFYNSPSLEDHMIKCSPGAASQKFTEMIRFHDEISSLRDGSNDNNNSHDNLLGKIGPTSVSCDKKDSSSNNVCMMDLSSDTTNNKDNTTQTQVVDYYDTSMFDV